MAVSFFDAFTPQEVARISAAGTSVRVPEGWSPIWEKTGADKAYIIVNGAASVRHGNKEIATLGPGDIIGEGAIVNHKLRNASVVMTTRTEVLHFTREQVEKLCDDIPGFKKALDEVAQERLGS
jgi:CRP-like cAMP-binding protein